jgi:hypothetical protein
MTTVNMGTIADRVKEIHALENHISLHERAVETAAASGAPAQWLSDWRLQLVELKAKLRELREVEVIVGSRR